MFIDQRMMKKKYTRKSKTGLEHTYYRHSIELVLRCDSCNEIFTRLRGKMDPNRINNNVFHVCGNCDAKRFAQRKGQERKAVWDLPASSNLDISKL
jgi:hypothetical protein